MKRTLGALTIGQSPRTDLIPEMRDILGQEVTILEQGALDGLTLEEVGRLRPDPGDHVLVTRMADGTAVKVGERHIVPRMQRGITTLVGEGADLIALVCTGEFPDFRCDRLVVRPQKVLFNSVASVGEGLKLGVVVPDPDQIDQAGRRWVGAAASVAVRAASPYGREEAIRVAALSLRDWGADVVALDCIGYTQAMKRAVREALGVPVVLARSVLARVLAELL